MRRRDIFRENTIDTPFSTTMGAPKFLSRFRELMETKIGLTIDMGGTEIGEATKSRGHKDPSGTLEFTIRLGPLRCKQRNKSIGWRTVPERRAHKADLLRA